MYQYKQIKFFKVIYFIYLRNCSIRITRHSAGRSIVLILQQLLAQQYRLQRRCLDTHYTKKKIQKKRKKGLFQTVDWRWFCWVIMHSMVSFAES